tara:strand:+ start:478 stop:654 length:177 start_codon:yes stop_codon:yes gene_type:complete
MSLSIVIPVFNEKNNVENLVKKIILIFKNKQIEIIIVDDSSIDGTTELLKKLQKNMSN